MAAPNQRFLIRWRTTSGENILFAHGTVAGDIGTIAEQQLTDPTDIGWTELNGCGWPLWKATTPEALVDVTATVQQWTAAA